MYVDESYQALMANTKWDEEAYDINERENLQPALITSSAGNKLRRGIHDMD